MTCMFSSSDSSILNVHIYLDIYLQHLMLNTNLLNFLIAVSFQLYDLKQQGFIERQEVNYLSSLYATISSESIDTRFLFIFSMLMT